MSEDKYPNTINTFREHIKCKNMGAEILGIHLEGPILHPDFRGAHNARYIYYPKLELFIENSDIIRMITLAPEMVSDKKDLECLKNKKICLAAGHTSLTMQKAKDSYANGVTHCTHIFNAMLP